MAIVNKIDSNATGLRIAEELSLGVLPGSPNWVAYEPNGYSDFGGEITTIARNPINPSRQRKKGVVTDLDASGGFGTDLTQTNLQDLLQGYFFADLRRKGEELVTAITLVGAQPDEYNVALTAGFLVGSLVKGKNFLNSANNSVNEVTVITTDASVEVAEGSLVAETTPADADLTVVGHVAASADLDVDATGTLPAITSTILDFTTLGLIPGEWIFVGGDGASDKFATPANNGFARIRSILANRIEFDKTGTTMATETGTGLTIHLYFGRVLKNELGTSIVRRTYQLERTLGAPDDASPADVQAEYILGAVPSELAFNIPTAEKATFDLSFIGTDNEQINGATALKTGNRPALSESDAFNTSSDFSRIKMATVSDTNSNPDPLFAFVTDLTFTLNNNVSPNKAVGVLGAFEVTAGTFEVGGSTTAYFSDVAAVAAVRGNADITIDAHLVKANAGITIDLPLLALGNGRLSVEQDQAITLPLDLAAATAAKIDSSLDYTLLMQFWDYLPNAADI